jgi:hypothetical protein
MTTSISQGALTLHITCGVNRKKAVYAHYGHDRRVITTHGVNGVLADKRRVGGAFEDTWDC